jgi:hypothetical protein
VKGWRAASIATLMYPILVPRSDPMSTPDLNGFEGYGLEQGWPRRCDGHHKRGIQKRSVPGADDGPTKSGAQVAPHLSTRDAPGAPASRFPFAERDGRGTQI